MNRAVAFGEGAYVTRIIDAEIDALFGELPALLLDGPKAVGKTATAERRATTIRRLDVAAEREVVSADPFVIAEDPRPVLLDEWQRLPSVFDAVRRLVDQDHSAGQFLLTGSAPVESTHSGAARIINLRMRPLTLSERLGIVDGVSLGRLLAGDPHIGGRTQLTLRDYAQEIVASGFPGMRHLTGPPLSRQLDGYLDRIVDHDLREAGFTVRRPATLMAWLRAYAAAVSTTASWEKIRDAATPNEGDKPAKATTIPYVELLTALRILDPLPAWQPSNNHLSALTGADKHHLADPALAARLTRLSATKLLHGTGPAGDVPRDGLYLGALFESLAVLCVRTLGQRHNAKISHLRTKGGRHEVDMVLEGTEGVIGMEAKLSSTVTEHDVTHLLWLRDKLGDECVDTVVLNTGPQAYRRQDGVAVVPLGLLVP